MQIRDFWFIYHLIREEDTNKERIRETMIKIYELIYKYPQVQEELENLALAIYSKEFGSAKDFLLDIIFKLF